MNFTDQIAQYIQENELDMKHLTIVLPSERAKKYISASLFLQAQQPLLAPEMITIDRWVKTLSPQTVIDKTRALLRLFSIQLEKLVDPKDASFDEFMVWGTTLLNDYDEIDRYMLSPKEVFKNLADIKEIENWSFGSETLSEGQKRFMEFWDRLPDYYIRLNEKLAKENACYMGNAYRYVAENINSVFATDPQRHFLFAGFNALSKAETSIMKQLHRLGRGHLIINADAYYLNNVHHEAGRFIRHFKQEIDVANLPFVENTLLTAEKNIQVIECAQHTGQVKVAATLLETFTPEEINETLILLADESLIAPLLKNLPKKITHANITLGLPLRNTALRTWVDLFFNIQENKLRFKSEAVYVNDLQKLWNHPFITALVSEKEQEEMVRIEQQIIRNNTIFISPASLRVGTIPDAILGLFTQHWQYDWLKAVQLIRQVNKLLFTHFKEQDAYEKALVQGFDKAMLELENLITEGFPTMQLKSFKSLFQQHWNTKNMAYHGNPLEGLQIMGLLETRLLDFKRIIVLGLNEGKMPSTNPIQTMIPMDLRSYLGLPTPRDKQGLFAHHFYRLLHQCENMWITYTSAQENIGSNEASRYLLQLELELARSNPSIQFSKQFYSIPNTSSQPINKQSVPKTSVIIERMDELFKRSISASFINNYLTCPLDFYYQKILDFGEEVTIEEEVESSSFGTFIHNVLEELYTPFARHHKDGTKKSAQPPNLTSFDIDGMLKHVDRLITEQFLNHFNKDKTAFASGKNLLSYRMAIELTTRILENEKRFLQAQTVPVFIEYLELELKADMEVEVNGEKRTVHFKGFIDRIDSVGGAVRIIDYKSGKVSDKDTKMGELKDNDYRAYFSNAKHAVQLVMYCFLYQRNFGALPSEAIIQSLVNISEGPFPLSVKNKTLHEVVEEYPAFMHEIFNELYDSSIPFEHKATNFNNFCSYCN